MKTLHFYDFDRSCLRGCAVLCGRDTRDVKWTAGTLTKARKATACRSCVRIYLKRQPVR